MATGPIFAAGDEPTATTVNLINPYTYILKTVDETVTSSTSLQDDNELTFTPVVSGVYEVTTFLRYTAGGAAATNGFKIGWTVPTAGVFHWVPHGKIDTDGTNAAAAIWQAYGSGATTINFGGAGASELVVRPYGLLIMSTNAGSFTLRWAQATSSGTGTVVKAGSFLIARRLV